MFVYQRCYNCFSSTRMKTLAIWNGWSSLIVLMFTAISVFLSVSAYQAHQVHVKVIYKYVQLAQFKKKCFARLYI